MIAVSPGVTSTAPATSIRLDRPALDSGDAARGERERREPDRHVDEKAGTP